MINESEVCLSYRDAKNKAKQIDILAELNVTTPVKIRDILEKNGFIVDSLSPEKPTASRQRWTRDMIETAARMWGDGMSLEVIAQQFNTTIPAITGVQHRNKDLFDHYAKTVMISPEIVDTPQLTPISTNQKAAQLLLTHGEKRFKPLPAAASPKLNDIALLITHAKTVHQSAVEALKCEQLVDCAYFLGELSQVLIRAKEATTKQ